MQKKLFLIFLLIFVLILSTGCSNLSEKSSLGDIHQVDVSEYVDSTRNIFKHFDLEYGYKKQTLYSELTGLKLQVPESWNISRENARYYRFILPTDDPVLPDTTIHMVFCIDTNLTAADPSRFDDIFDREQSGLLYDIEGSKFYETYNSVPSQKFVDRRVTEDPSLLSCSIYSDIELTGPIGNILDKDMVSVRYNSLAGSTPVLLCTVVEKENEAAARDILAMLTSSFGEYEVLSPTLEEAEFSEVKMMLPADFKRTKVNGAAIYKASEQADSPYSGMAVLVSDLGTGEFDEYEFSKGTLSSIGGYFVPQGTYTCMYSIINNAESILLGNISADFAVSNFTYHQKENQAATFLGTSGDAMIFLYIFNAEDSGKKAICFFFKPYQAKEAAYVDQLIRETTRF